MAGKTSFSGSASCFMPYQIEFEEQKTVETSEEDQTTPKVIGANGEYEIQKEVITNTEEEASFLDEDGITKIKEATTYPARGSNPEAGPNSETIVYTIYAR